MRFFLFLGLMGCGADTFTSGDGSVVDGSGDAIGDVADARVGDGGACVWCPITSPTMQDIVGVAGRSQNEVAIITASSAHWWNGNTWTNIPIAGVTNYTLKGISVSSTLEIWVVGSDQNGGIHLQGTPTGLSTSNVLSMVAVRASSYNAVKHYNSTFGVLVGTGAPSTFVTSQGGTGSPGSTDYFGVDYEGTNNAIAVGAGKVAQYTAAWVETNLPGTHRAVSGNAMGGWIAGDGGEIRRYANMNGFQSYAVPTGTQRDLLGIYVRYTTNDVWAVGKNGTIARIVNGQGAAVMENSGTTRDLNAMWGDMNGVWAVGASGTILRRP